MKKSNKIPCIVVDLDDVLVEFLEPLLNFYNEAHDTSLYKTNVKDWAFKNLKVKDINNVTVTGKIVYKFFKKYENYGFYAILPVIRSSMKALEYFKNFGYNIIILTARDKKHERVTEINLNFKNKVIYDEIIFSKSKKESIIRLAKKYHIYAFIDDNLKEVKEVFNMGIVDKCYLVNKSYNKYEKINKKIERIDNLIEIVKNL